MSRLLNDIDFYYEGKAMSTIGRKTLAERGLRSTEAGPDHPIYKRGLIIGGVSTSPSSTSGSGEPKAQPKDGASPPNISKEEMDRQFQEAMKEHDEEIREAALNQWGASTPDDPEESGDK